MRQRATYAFQSWLDAYGDDDDNIAENGDDGQRGEADQSCDHLDVEKGETRPLDTRRCQTRLGIEVNPFSPLFSSAAFLSSSDVTTISLEN